MKIVMAVRPNWSRVRPLTRGPHTLAELARLVAAGRTLKEIAVLWGMRPRAGPQDLLHEVRNAWKKAGEPGGAVRPPGYGPRHDAAWRAWWAARDAAIEAWLETFVEDAPHCETCSCYTGPQAQPCPNSGRGC